MPGGGAGFDEAVIRAVSIALDDAFKTGRNDAFQAGGSAPGAPGEAAQLADRIVKDPQITGATGAFAGGVLIFDGRLPAGFLKNKWLAVSAALRLVRLHITSAKTSAFVAVMMRP
jgi:hypothetical protein